MVTGESVAAVICSGVDSALLDRESHAVYSKHVGGDAIVHVVRFGIPDHIVKALGENAVKLLVDDGFLPEVALSILHPLKVGSSNPAGIGQDVGNDKDTLLRQHLIGDSGGGTV